MYRFQCGPRIMVGSNPLIGIGWKFADEGRYPRHEGIPINRGQCAGYEIPPTHYGQLNHRY